MAAVSKSQKRRKTEEKVDVADLHFGDDFDGAEAMLNAEVKLVIDSLNKRKQLEFDDLSDVMQNACTYVDTFGEFQDTDSIQICKK
jgi:hypothetical protein